MVTFDLNIYLHFDIYKKCKIVKAYNKKVKPKVFKKGYPVLKKISMVSGEYQSKWAPNYEGPYMVRIFFFFEEL